MTIQDTILRIQTRMDLEQIKVPIGFIRLIELLFAMIAYASVNSWDFDMKYVCTCKYGGNNTTFTKGITLTDLNLNNVQITKCDGSVVPLFTDNFDSGTDFYSYIIVFSIFYTIGTVLFYLFCWPAYVSDDRLPVIDLTITVILAFSWLIGTYSFSSAAAKIEKATAPSNIKSLLKSCCDKKCTADSYAMDSNLTVATIAGVGCIMLFAANIWFVYKETANYRSRTTQNIQVQQQDPYTLE